MSIVLKALWRLFSAYRPKKAKARKGRGKGEATHFEVERKFRLQEDEVEAVSQRLADMGFTLANRIEMTDQFLPVKVEGEMLRVRDEKIGAEEHSLLTIKEWVVIAGSKEREETEGRLAPFARRLLLWLGKLLRGKKLLSFSKLRLDHTSLQRTHVVIALDQVSGLGNNSGHYAEIEVLVARDGDVEAARAQIKALALALFNEEREPVMMSYMDMLKLVS